MNILASVDRIHILNCIANLHAVKFPDGADEDRRVKVLEALRKQLTEKAEARS